MSTSFRFFTRPALQARSIRKRTSLALFSALFSLFALAPSASAQSAPRQVRGPFGLGLIVGEPTGMVGKLYLSPKHAVDAAVGVGFVGGRGVHIHADYLIHPFLLTRAPTFVLPFYFGIGGRIHSHDKGKDKDHHTSIGPRIPAGILFDFRNVPLDVFLEAAIGMDIMVGDENDDGLTLDVSAGARFYF